MKKAFRSFFTFSRTETRGLIALLSLLIILIAIRATMQFWVKPDIDPAQQQRLTKAWQEFKQKQTNSDSIPNTSLTTNNSPLTTPINLNTADSSTLCSLPGIGPALSQRIIQHRRKHPFKSIEELLTIPRFSHSTFFKIRSHITVK
jgi:competence protein ComEA